MITLESGPFGFCYLLVNDDGRDILIQTDYEYPAVASLFGWSPCEECRETDGTIDCRHKTASTMISEAAEFLDDHIGESVEDPGYFS